MIILPAIDIKDRQCVRLYKGDFSTVHKVSNDPIQTAKSFVQDGATWIHTVDLDGAKDKISKNKDIFIKIKKATGAKIELGGGIRDIETAKYYFSNGIDRLILGSIAISNPTLTKEIISKFGDKIAIGIDAKNGWVATNGWVNTSNISYIDLAKQMEDMGAKYIIYTDISKDGTLEGANLEELNNINNAVSCNIIASGGIKDINDIKKLHDVNLYGVICGKSLYQKTLLLEDAIKFNKI